MGAISDARNNSNGNPFQETRRDLHRLRPQIEKVLPEHVTVDRIERITLNELRRNPKLLQCDRNSLFGAVMQCAVTGLEPGPLGHAYLIPFKGKVQWVAGYKGLIDLAFRSGNLANVYAMVVRESDEFDFQFGTNGYIHHTPNLRASADEPILAAYSVAELKTGGTQFELMPAGEINRIRDEKSESSGNSWSPWQTDYNEMAKKTVFRRMSKWLPVSIELRDAWQSVHGHDEQIIEMDDSAIVKSKSTSKRRQSPEQLESTPDDDQVFDDEGPRVRDKVRNSEQYERNGQVRGQQQQQQKRHPNAPPQQERRRPQQRRGPDPNQMHGAGDGDGDTDARSHRAANERQRPYSGQPAQNQLGGRNLEGPGIDVPEATVDSIANSSNNYSDSQAWKKANRSASATMSTRYSQLDDETKEQFKVALGHKYGVPNHEHIPPAWLSKEIAFLQSTEYEDPDDGAMSERDEYITNVIDYYHE